MGSLDKILRSMEAWPGGERIFIAASVVDQELIDLNYTILGKRVVVIPDVLISKDRTMDMKALLQTVLNGENK